MLQADWTSHCTLSAISVQWLELVYEMAKFFSFCQSFGRNFWLKWIIKILSGLNEGHLRFFDLKKVEIIEEMMRASSQLQF